MDPAARQTPEKLQTNSPQELLTDSLQRDFSDDSYAKWRYVSSNQDLPYRKSVNYARDISDPNSFDSRNQQEAQSALLSDSGLSINDGQGLHIGLVYRATSNKDGSYSRASFALPVRLAEAISGEQPPITAEYPRVEFPNQEPVNYAVLVAVDTDNNRFGLQRDVRNLEVADRTMDSELLLPEGIVCPDAIRQAISDFHPRNERPNSSYLPQGDYKIKLEYERYPLVFIRIDGGMPLSSTLRYTGDAKLELPIMSLLKDLDFGQYLSGSGTKSPKIKENNPFKRTVSTEKYVEMGSVIPFDHNGFIPFESAALEYEGRRETAELVYSPVSRVESVELNASNPNTGLVEVQIEYGVKLTSIDIEFTPQKISAPEPELDKDRGFDFGHTRSIDSFGGGFALRSMSFGSSSRPTINTGATSLANPKSGPVSPKVEMEWGGHAYTFRLALTNQQV